MSLEMACVYFSDGKCTKFSEPGYVSYCGYGPCGYEKLSNGDKIRSMTDEELADKIYSIAASCPEGKRPEGTCVVNAYDCGACWLSWLKSPVEGGE